MNQNKRSKQWFYLTPSMILIGAIVIFPILYTGYISLTNMSLYHWKDFKVIGLANYGRALFKLDEGFLSALATTLLWTVVNMVLQIVAAFFIALGLNAPGMKLTRLYKTLLMVPWAMPSYVSILIWRVGIYNTDFGLLNKFRAALGLSRISYLAENVPAFLSCLVLNLWMAFPFMIMMFDAAMQSVDRSLLEGASLDGAGFFMKVRYVLVPAIRPIMLPPIIMTAFTTFKQFDIFYLLTMQKGALTGSTLQTIITYAQQNAFVSNNYGLSSAVSMMIFVLICLFSLYSNRNIGREDEIG